MPQTVLITGTGRAMGLGFNLVRRYLEAGDRVLASVRRPSEALETLRQPMTLDGYTIRPAQVERLETLPDGARLAVTIHEGRNRQVRRMTAAIGYPTLRLVRWSIGDWTIDGIPPGEWREG